MYDILNIYVGANKWLRYLDVVKFGPKMMSYCHNSVAVFNPLFLAQQTAQKLSAHHPEIKQGNGIQYLSRFNTCFSLISQPYCFQKLNVLYNLALMWHLF